MCKTRNETNERTNEKCLGIIKIISIFYFYFLALEFFLLCLSVSSVCSTVFTSVYVSDNCCKTLFSWNSLMLISRMMEWHGRKMAWREYIMEMTKKKKAHLRKPDFFFYFFLLCFPFFWLGFTFYFLLVVLCFIHHVTRERKNGCRGRRSSIKLP